MSDFIKNVGLLILLLCFGTQVQGQQLRNIIDSSLSSAQGESVSLRSSALDDYGFARRLFLDLTGRIPTVSELLEFVEDSNEQKREALVERLLSSPVYARHMQHTFDVMFMERLPKKYIPPEDFQAYLRKSFTKNKPYDQLVKEMLSADGSVTEMRPASRFLLDREIKREETVRAIGRVFLGRDLQCAQCHNHPNVDDYLQQHYYGVAAFLQRSYLFTDPSSKLVSIGDKIEGDVTFTSVFTGEDGKTQPRILELPEIEDPQQDAEPYAVKPDSKNRGVPKYTRRLKLATAMTSPENVAFRKNITNRIWAMLMGQGFVEPLDMFHEANAPSHPELLTAMATDFMSHNYDVKYLIREIVMTQAYQRQSEFMSGDAESDRPLYLHGTMKPLSPEQFAWSILQAVGMVEKTKLAVMAELKKESSDFDAADAGNVVLIEEKVDAALKSQVDAIVTVFAGSNAAARFDASANHALYLLNGPEVAKWLKSGQELLLDNLLVTENNEELVKEAFLAIYSRLPDAAELKLTTEFIAAMQGNREQATRELVRTLLCSAEFRFNK
ncbi:MAG: hypothetical protein CMJ76_08130 [Planctomycetaceae bacterium]|mgnify:CR=1 FL=1|nr:hypothetical protein [Planctomycetaceae bacterium]|tara:strand:- start:487 stop:2151 length:1665 start_codon:yes stop_codon:yes gene_type:complete